MLTIHKKGDTDDTIFGRHPDTNTETLKTEGDFWKDYVESQRDIGLSDEQIAQSIEGFAEKRQNMWRKQNDT